MWVVYLHGDGSSARWLKWSTRCGTRCPDRDGTIPADVPPGSRRYDRVYNCCSEARTVGALVMGSAERELLPKGMRYALGLRLVLVGASSLFALFLVSAPNQAVTTAIVLAFNLWSVWFAGRLVRATDRVGSRSTRHSSRSGMTKSHRLSCWNCGMVHRSVSTRPVCTSRARAEQVPVSVVAGADIDAVGIVEVPASHNRKVR
jgi:hypothetical protein